MGIFDNVDSIVIGSKEVESIKVTSNNAVLYEKPSSVVDNYVLSMSSDKDILSYYDNDTATITATLTNNNVPVSDKLVVFDNGNHNDISINNNDSSATVSQNSYKIILPSNLDDHSSMRITLYGNPSNPYTLHIKRKDITSSVWCLNHPPTNTTIELGSNEVIVDGGWLYYEDVNGNGCKYDVSNYNVNSLTVLNMGNTTIKTNFFADITDSNGEATCTYNSQGVGDVSIKAECMLLQEIYELQDCEYYNTTSHSSEVQINYNLIAKDNAKVEFDLTKSESNSGAFLIMGDDENNYWGIGLLGSGYYGILVQHNGSRETTQSVSGLPNGTFHVLFEYNNGVGTWLINNHSYLTNYTQSLTKLIRTACWNGGSIKNIKIKPL